jgi:hypothetical protein
MWLAEEDKVLHESGVPDVIYRAQGKIEVLKRILAIEKDTQEYQAGLLKGTFKERKQDAIKMVRF